MFFILMLFMCLILLIYSFIFFFHRQWYIFFLILKEKKNILKIKWATVISSWLLQKWSLSLLAFMEIIFLSLSYIIVFLKKYFVSAFFIIGKINHRFFFCCYAIFRFKIIKIISIVSFFLMTLIILKTK